MGVSVGSTSPTFGSISTLKPSKIPLCSPSQDSFALVGVRSFTLISLGISGAKKGIENFRCESEVGWICFECELDVTEIQMRF